MIDDAPRERLPDMSERAPRLSYKFQRLRERLREAAKLGFKQALIPAAKTYFKTEQPKEGTYTPMITAADKPIISRNGDIMATYRPLMKPFYYDASKYPTYLDQLGIKFPELTPAK